MPETRNWPPSVLHVDTERTWRGGQQQMLYLASGLAQRGWTSEVLCRPGSPALSRCEQAGLTTHPIAIRGEWDLPSARRLARLVSSNGYGIVHAHTAHGVLPCSWALRRLRPRPKLVAHRRIDYSIHKLPFRLSLLKYKTGVDCFIAVSDAVKRVMIRDGLPERDIFVVHSSTDVSRFRNVERDRDLRSGLGIPEDAPLVGNVGYLVGHKGHTYLLDAFAKVVEQVASAHLLIAGEGKLRPQLEAQAARLGIADRTHMPGFREDIPQLLAEMDVFALSSWAEGTPGTLCEAASAGVAIVSTDAGGVPELIKDAENGLLVPMRDPVALAQGIVRLLQSPELRASLAENALRTVSGDFSKEGLVEKTIEVYRQLLSRDRG